MNPTEYFELKEALIKKGYEQEIWWSEDIKICEDSSSFCQQYIFVLCNSGMKAQIAVVIYQKILQAIVDHVDISEVFGHEGKVKAIKAMIKGHKTIFQEYLKSDDKLEFCVSLPWIGDITKYHLVKNLGVDCIKPDRHLVRIAEKHGTDAFALCEELSKITGDKLTTVDTVLWRSANLGMI